MSFVEKENVRDAKTFHIFLFVLYPSLFFHNLVSFPVNFKYMIARQNKYKKKIKLSSSESLFFKESSAFKTYNMEIMRLDFQKW